MARGFSDRSMRGVTLAGARVLGRVSDGVPDLPTWDVVFACGHEGRILKTALRAAANAGRRLVCADCRALEPEQQPSGLWADRVLAIFEQPRERFSVACTGCRGLFGTKEGLLSHLHKCNGPASIGLTRDEYRSGRKRDVRGRTISVKRMTKRELQAGRALYPESFARPRSRGDCDCVPRPCPFVACRFNLYLDVSPQTGAIKLNFPDLEPDQMRESCVLDVAEAGGETLEHVGELANLTRERVRQIEQKALVRLRVFPIHEFADDGEKRRPVRAHQHRETP